MNLTFRLDRIHHRHRSRAAPGRTAVKTKGNQWAHAIHYVSHNMNFQLDELIP